MNGSRMTLAALSDHERAAFAAKQPRRQDVVVLRLTHGGGFLIPRHDFLHTVEQLFGDDGRNGIQRRYCGLFGRTRCYMGRSDVADRRAGEKDG